MTCTADHEVNIMERRVGDRAPTAAFEYTPWVLRFLQAVLRFWKNIYMFARYWYSIFIEKKKYWVRVKFIKKVWHKLGREGWILYLSIKKTNTNYLQFSYELNLNEYLKKKKAQTNYKLLYATLFLYGTARPCIKNK